jgi:hypothetical protein
MDATFQAEGALRELEAALATPEVPERVARSFEALADRIRRPVRVTIFGVEGRRRKGLFSSILGWAPFRVDAEWPTLEMSYAENPHMSAILSDGSALSADDLPGDDLLARAPAFVRIKAPVEVLARMSFLYVSAGFDEAEQAAALRWAAPRTDVSVWCTRRFTPREAAIWSSAPDSLKDHAQLAVMGNDDDFALVRHRRPSDFEGLVALPKPNVSPLLQRIDASVASALGEDLDAARVLMHRFGVRAPARTAARSEPATRESHAPDDLVAILSEPLLFVRRRARAILELMDWREAEAGDWAAMVLEHGRETMEALRDRAVAWPDENDEIAALRQFIQDASDLAVLLQVEGGEEQAADASALLCQVRETLDRTLAPGAPTQDRGTR